MKCRVCGAESGKYPLCRVCNVKKEKGEIIKCEKCKNWHYANASCPVPDTATADDKYLYNTKSTLISKSEKVSTIQLKLPSRIYTMCFRK